MNIATTILNQLGGNKFLAMTGSKNLVALENGLQMHLTRNTLKAKSLRIELDANDTYTMTFHTWDKYYTPKVLAEIKMVYADMLQAIFTKQTGLDTHL